MEGKEYWERDIFDGISPIDYRYWDNDVAKYLSENAFVRYKMSVEIALMRVLDRREACPEEAVGDTVRACSLTRTNEVYVEEKRIGHDIRALVNCIRAKVSDAIKPYVHMTATSFDVVDTANAARYKATINCVLIPSLKTLEGVLIDLAIREADTVQIGRTHGQHAVPITFGFAIAEYVSRLGGCIEELEAKANKLVGKFSGAVGAYNASSLFFEDPEDFETEVLNKLFLFPAEHSTQVVPPEALTRLMSEVVVTTGVLANLADDIRHLQRTEIGEVGEDFGENQVGSSTMPQKRNPINFENAKSCWKIIMPRIITVFMDQISEHQRDLTNSASGRTYGEIIAYAVEVTKRLTRTMKKLKVDRENMKKNLDMTGSAVLAEPLQIILSALGHPNAHEAVRQFTLATESERCSLWVEFQEYIAKMTSRQKEILSNPRLYIGIAPKKARDVANNWKKRLGL